jgi:phosphoribosylformylglycinamidine cyclo-ligase
MDYKQAGVDVEEGYRAVDKYRDLAAATATASVLNGIGSFAGMFSIGDLIRAGKGMEDPILVAGTDGVGTKLDIAFRLKKYDTIGIDCVAMCVNDVLCHGARPLFFLDYLACGKLDAGIAAEIVKGVADGCRETGSVLLGGETAEMPGFYDEDKYDIAGFSVGIVDRKKIIEGKKIREGDALIGLSSSGPHSNGFSLIRKVLPDLQEEFGGGTLGLALLEPTMLYVKPVLALMEQIEIQGMAHITGGGFFENIPRMFAPPLTGAPCKDALIQVDSWPILPVFHRITAGVAGTTLSGSAALIRGEEILNTDKNIRKLMFNTYNMGIGFVLALAPADVKTAITFLSGQGYPAWEIGRVAAGEGRTGEVRLV